MRNSLASRIEARAIYRKLYILVLKAGNFYITFFFFLPFSEHIVLCLGDKSLIMITDIFIGCLFQFKKYKIIFHMQMLLTTFVMSRTYNETLRPTKDLT